MKIQTIKEADLSNKKVLLRADLNVPTKDGKVTDTTRIEAVKPTVDFLLKNNAQVIICSHFGRPKGEKKDELSLKHILPTIEEILEYEVQFIDDCIDIEVPDAPISLLENTRFHKEEKENDADFAQKLASHADIFVMDAFGAAHRAHASTEGVTNHLPSYAGLLLESEINSMAPLLDSKQIEKPLTLIIGGAKIDTKIGILNNFLDKADNIIIGGALANTFLLAQGHDVGKSLVEEDQVETAQEILMKASETGCTILLPKDVIVADEISKEATAIDIPIEDVELDMMILDIGKNTMESYVELIQNSKTIVMNGPLGLYEFPQFEAGTYVILEALAASNSTTIVGGGDSVDALNKFNIPHKKFTHISTGGGAMIEFLEGKQLPAIAPLIKS